jgi:hypothetical protein
MNFLTALDPFLNLALGVLQFIGNEQAMSYVSQLNNARLELQAELSKGANADDGKVESLYGQIQILGQTVQEQFSIYQAQKGSAPVPTAPTAAGV